VERGVVQVQLLERLAQGLVLVRLHRVEPREHLRLDLLEPGQRLRRGLVGVGHRVADLRRAQLLDPRRDVAHLAREQAVLLLGLGSEHADVVAEIRRVGAHQQDLVLRPQRSLHDPDEHHHADVVVEPRIDDQRLQARPGIALRRGHAGNDRFKDLRHVVAGLGAHAQGILRGDADHVLDLLDRLDRIGRGQVDLVQHRDHFHALLDRGVAVRDGLGFDALRGVDHEHRALAGRERAAHLVGKVDVPRSVDQVQQIDFPRTGLVLEGRGLGLDRNAALALEVHRVEHLLGHLALGKAAAHLDEPVGERRLAVVDVRDDREVADAALGHIKKEGARRAFGGHPPRGAILA
jgi:hypothetical protein